MNNLNLPKLLQIRQADQAVADEHQEHKKSTPAKQQPDPKQQSDL